MKSTPNDDSMPDWAQENTEPATPLEVESGTRTNNNNTAATTTATSGNTTTSNAAHQRPTFKEMIQRDGRLLLIILAIIIIMNVPYLRFILYPFTLFATWIHELCHGLAGVLMGGKITQLFVYKDGSGLAFTTLPTTKRRWFVSSAGYQGTAVVGCLLLLLRRTKRGPRSVLMGMGCWMILSVLLWVRNAFGIFIVLLLGVIFVLCAYFLPSGWVRSIYIIIAATTALNAITGIRALFGNNYLVNGDEVETDAHTMGEITALPAVVWALWWMIFALILTIVGLVFAIPGPDEPADFQCCGVCVDAGCFKCLNSTTRWRQRFSGGGGNGATASGSSATTGATVPATTTIESGQSRP